MEDSLNIVTKVMAWIIPILFAITVHEVAHGWVANKLGDSTAKMAGRLTLNPIKHIDLIGTIIIPTVLYFLGGFIFGWAKPVPVNYQQLRHPKRDMALVSIAGPLANLLMLMIWVIVVKVGLSLEETHTSIANVCLYMGKIGISINLILMVLNVLPIPPLDGSRVVASLLPDKMAEEYNKIEPFGFFILVILLASGLLTKIMLPIMSVFKNIIGYFLGL